MHLVVHRVAVALRDDAHRHLAGPKAVGLDGARQARAGATRPREVIVVAGSVSVMRRSSLSRVSTCTAMMFSGLSMDEWCAGRTRTPTPCWRQDLNLVRLPISPPARDERGAACCDLSVFATGRSSPHSLPRHSRGDSGSQAPTQRSKRHPASHGESRRERRSLRKLPGRLAGCARRTLRPADRSDLPLRPHGRRHRRRRRRTAAMIGSPTWPPTEPT